jgi:hypothetical protein
MLRSPRRLLALAALATVAAGCRTATEIVIILDTMGAPPPQILVKLSRSTPFITDPTTPPFIDARLDDPGLDLAVTPQGPETLFSLLPPSGGPNDLQVTVTVPTPGYTVDPSITQKLSFIDHKSQQLHFVIAAPLPDGGMHRDAGLDGPHPG